jgi:hypothetical protein
MSCYVVSNIHISAILRYAAEARLTLYPAARGGEPWRAASVTVRQELGEMIQSLNVDAMRERYPDSFAEESVRLFLLEKAAPRAPVEVIKLIDGLTYQLCGLEDWDTTDAGRILLNIRDHAITKLPGYSEAQWSLD